MLTEFQATWQVTLLLRSLEAQGSNLGTEISYNERFSWRSSATPQECRDVLTLRDSHAVVRN